MKAPVIPKFLLCDNKGLFVFECFKCKVHLVREEDTNYGNIPGFSNCLLAEEENCMNFFIVVPEFCEGTDEKAPNWSDIKCLNWTKNDRI